jgi:HK97 family phage major capsid protein
VLETRGTASWVDEAGTIPETDNTFGQITLSAYKLATAIKISNELLQDSAFDLESFVSTEFARRLGEAEETAFFTGDGTGKPTGLLNATGGAETVEAAGQTAITLDDIMDLYHALRAPYRANAVFITNDLTVKAIRKLKDSSGQYLWQPSTQVGTPNTILGRPYYTSVNMPEIAASAKTVLFGDFSYYWIADRLGITLMRDPYTSAITDQVMFIARKRVDAKLVLPEAIKVLVQKDAT